MEMILCGLDFSDGSIAESNVELCAQAAATGRDLQNQSVGHIDAVVVGTSNSNSLVQKAFERLQIPNLHCSGGNPALWTSATPHAFGMHVPVPWYRGAPCAKQS
jgi:hypothetical protein